MSLSVPLEPPSKEILHISAHYLVILVIYIYIQFNSIQYKFCVLPVLVWVCRGKNRKGHTNQHLHGCFTAAEPALESQHLKPKKYNVLTHLNKAHNIRCITNKHGHPQPYTDTVTCKPFTYTNKKTSMSGGNAYGHKQIDAWLHR